MDPHYLVPHHCLRPIYMSSISKTGGGCQAVGVHGGLQMLQGLLLLRTWYLGTPATLKFDKKPCMG